MKKVTNNEPTWQNAESGQRETNTYNQIFIDGVLNKEATMIYSNILTTQGKKQQDIKKRKKRNCW